MPTKEDLLAKLEKFIVDGIQNAAEAWVFVDDPPPGTVLDLAKLEEILNMEPAAAVTVLLVKAKKGEPSPLIAPSISHLHGQQIPEGALTNSWELPREMTS